jgi:hypothetical protein
MMEYNNIDTIADSVAAYAKSLMARGLDPYFTLQLALGFQATLLQKANDVYPAPGWPTEENHNGTKERSS